jgi:nitrogen fixation protein NifQ
MDAASPDADLDGQDICTVSIGGRHADPARPSGREFYRALTGRTPEDASLDRDDGFDTHIFASILAVAASEGINVAERAGLASAELTSLFTRRFPHALAIVPLWSTRCEGIADEDEITMLRDLLIANRSSGGEDGPLLAAMIARRAMEPNHLWEDLGLRNRQELTRLIARHFAPLAAANVNNMRWKRFFYRKLCEAEGFSMCSTPVCSACTDFALCFGEETGESRLAQVRRNQDLKAASLAVQQLRLKTQ